MKWVIQRQVIPGSSKGAQYWNGFSGFETNISHACQYEFLNDCQTTLNKLVNEGWEDLSPIQVNL
mgnify:CR=1 FL=1